MNQSTKTLLKSRRNTSNPSATLKMHLGVENFISHTHCEGFSLPVAERYCNRNYNKLINKEIRLKTFSALYLGLCIILDFMLIFIECMYLFGHHSNESTIHNNKKLFDLFSSIYVSFSCMCCLILYSNEPN